MKQSVLFDSPGPRARNWIRIGNIAAGVLAVGVLIWVLTALNTAGQLAPELWKPVVEARSWQFYLLPGLQNTLVAAFYSIIGALAFGLFFGVGRLAPNAAFRWFCGVVVEFFRAVPVLIMMIAGWLWLSKSAPDTRDINSLIAVVAALILYNGSVIAELVRSGVHGLPKGQREAGLAIGLTRTQSIFQVELPQALIAMLPALVSQFVVILKDSALGAIVLYPELLRQAQLLGTGAPRPILQMLFVAAVLFIVLNTALGWLAGWVARRIGSRTSGKATVRPTVGPVVVGAGPAKED